MKNSFLTLVFTFFVLVGCAQNKKQITPKSHIAYKTSEKIVIDGNDYETSWKDVEWSDAFIDIQGVIKPKYETKIKMLWDDTYFYILAKLEEPHVWATIKDHDAIIFYNNDFEVFVDPEGNNHGYYELEINALNTVWDLFISKPYRELNQPILNDWNVTGLKSAIKVNGTLNNPNDIDKGWNVEMAIPWSVYKTAYFHENVPKDTFWRVNFSRVNWDHQLVDGKYERKKDSNGKPLHEYNWVWSPQGVINMHEPEKWGYVYFSSKKAGEKDTFEIPDDEKIKWKLYEMYRNQKKYYLKNNKWLTSIDSIGEREIMIDSKVVKPVLENHSQGWNITVVSPFTGKQIVIREDGELIIN
ncbi:MAG: carbohydrate-binding family 9-like protein [Bacteroidota bacterium]